MPPKVTRRRLLDAAVTLVAVALCTAPFVGQGLASVSDTPIAVDQVVLENVLISQPLNGAFALRGSGRSTGGVEWDVYTSSERGYKLVVATSSRPALFDAKRGAGVPDLGGKLQRWTDSSARRRFGFTARGAHAMTPFGSGTRWRGFDGARGLEVARHTAASSSTRTSVQVSAELRSPLPAGTRPTAHVFATAVGNL